MSKVPTDVIKVKIFDVNEFFKDIVIFGGLGCCLYYAAKKIDKLEKELDAVIEGA